METYLLLAYGGIRNTYTSFFADSVVQIYDQKTGQCLHIMTTAISFDSVINLGKHYFACPGIKYNTDPKVYSKFTIWDTRLSHAEPVHPAVNGKFVELKVLSTGQVVALTDKHAITLLTFPTHQLQEKATVKTAPPSFFQPIPVINTPTASCQCTIHRTNIPSDKSSRALDFLIW